MSVSCRFLLAGLCGVSYGPAALAAPDQPPAVLPLKTEPAARLTVYPAVPQALARGVIILQFRTENFRVMPLFGPQAAEVSPHVGHLHVTVDNAPPTWAHTSGDPIIVVGLTPGPHRIKLELADPTHKIVGGETVTVTVPDTKGGKAR